MKLVEERQSKTKPPLTGLTIYLDPDEVQAIKDFATDGYRLEYYSPGCSIWRLINAITKVEL